MAENYTIKPFGLNIIPQETTDNAGKKVEQAIGNLWAPVLDYLKENDDVFSGNISMEIEKANIQTLNLGMAMRSGQDKHSLDEKW